MRVVGGASQYESSMGGEGYISSPSRARRPEERRSFGVRRMVACAVAVAAIHSSSSVVGGGERRVPLASPEVGRVALLAPKTGAMSATPVDAIELLKNQLKLAVENKDPEKATLAIEELERIVLTKDSLESTRIGLTVNNARRDMQEQMPALSKRCRALIKLWQRLVEPSTTTSSTATSRNGTPSLVSPAVGRRVTPHTPANKRITPGLASERAATISPANGSYAPKGSNNVSPTAHSALHKSMSVGNDLLKDGENGGVRNGKRKGDEPVPGATPSTIKRAKTTASGLAAAGSLTSPSPSTTSLIASRRAAVQSTSDLVAELTSDLPQHMGFETAVRQHEERVRREQEDQQLAAALASGGQPPQSPYVFEKKRKYERKQKPGALSTTPSTPSLSAAASSSSTTTVCIVTPPADERKGGLVLRIARTNTEASSLQQSASATSERDRKEEKEQRKREKREAAFHASKSAPSLAQMDAASSSSSSLKVLEPPESQPSTSTSSSMSSYSAAAHAALTASAATSGKVRSRVLLATNHANVDWLAMVPSLEVLRQRAEVDKKRRAELASKLTNNEKAYSINLGDRVVLALPYIEIEDKPDFIKFKYPVPGRFYAEENFINGTIDRPASSSEHPVFDGSDRLCK